MYLYWLRLGVGLCPEWGSGNQPKGKLVIERPPGCGSFNNEFPCKGLSVPQSRPPAVITFSNPPP